MNDIARIVSRKRVMIFESLLNLLFMIYEIFTIVQIKMTHDLETVN